MEKTKLEMEFLDAANKKFVVSIDGPRIDLTPVEVKTAMDALIGFNVFGSDVQNLASANDARIITTTVDTLSI